MAEESETLEETRATIENTLRNLQNAKQFAFDIGSSLVKIAYSSSVSKTKTNYDRTECGPLRVKSAVCTGSGTTQYQDIIANAIGVEFHKVNEMECLVKGNNFLLNNILDEAFTYDHHNDVCKYSFETINTKSQFPYLLVNIGTGVSIYKVESDECFERVGGSSMGGGCFFGMGSLLTHTNDFDALMRMAEEGDHRSMDILVSDIYGGRAHKLGLPNDLIAGSFGKCADAEYVEAIKKNSHYRSDVLRSLLLMISNSIGQIAVLYASTLNANRIYFGGYFIRNHPIVMRTMTFAVNFWSQGEIQAQFLRHESYTSAIGAFLKGVEMFSDSHPEEADPCYMCSWKEHYAGSTALGRFVPTAPLSSSFNVGVLEMECCEMNLSMFPLLRSDIVYRPDTVSLNHDPEAREYWIHCMEGSIEKTIVKAVESQLNCADVRQRAENVKRKYLEHLKILREKPFAYGCCNVRNLLDLREQILNQFLFDDAFLNQKRFENERAMEELSAVLKEVDAVSSERDRQILVVKGLLAGNVFDWGAKEVVKLMEDNGGLTFKMATDVLQKRPWLVDDLDVWLEAYFSNGYRCALIFVDNSGADVLLGVLPFARELIRHHTKVIIACNWSPALNDITAYEMEALMDGICEKDETIKNAVLERRLIVCNSGQGSPCLDFRRINSSLCELVVSECVDLVVIEGMGRAIHTNFDAHFTCDSLKAAVIKTKWLADRLGGSVFSVVCKFEHGSHRAVAS
uniref:4'-phosphopantetheine phosphatase n=1 Tax=Parascaris univalens TaxID=6257 RepID=A0A915C011_PARUN